MIYLWYRFLLRFLSDLKKKQDYPPFKSKCSVIVPVYNEKSYMLEMCVDSLCKADGDNQIIVVDDKSTDFSWEKIRELKTKFPQIKIIRLKDNRGKRYAQYVGLHFATGDIIITVDSDTIVAKNALAELIKPFNDSMVGATTGNVRAFNREYNFLTKMIDVRYKNAFTFERQGLSSFGVVTCCSGALSAYRKELLLKIKERYISQKFLGSECTYGDDRHLTNLILRMGFRAEYVLGAIVYTDVPTKFFGFLKQQTRWKKSFIRESLIALEYSLKNNKLLFFETLYSFLLPIISIFLRIFLVFTLIIQPVLLLPVIISIALLALLRNMLLFFEDRESFLYVIPYAILHEVVIHWLFWVAMFTLKDRRWGTR